MLGAEAYIRSKVHVAKLQHKNYFRGYYKTLRKYTTTDNQQHRNFFTPNLGKKREKKLFGVEVMLKQEVSSI